MTSVISMSYMSTDAVRFSRLPGPANTTPRVHVFASSGLTSGLPRGISFSDWKNGRPGRTKPLGPGGPKVDPVFVSNADWPSLPGFVSLRLMISRQRVCTASRLGFDARLPHGAVVDAWHGSP